MTKKPPATEERTQFIQDAILRETVKMENRYHRDFVDFYPSINALKDATPDKPGVHSFCSDVHNDDDLDDEMMKTLSIKDRTSGYDLHTKYQVPMTTSMEIGWDIAEFGQYKSMFDHRHRNTDVTNQPSKWDPSANPVAAKDPK